MNTKTTALYFGLALLIISIAGAYIRLANIENQCLWMDESISVIYWLPDVSLRTMIEGSVANNAFPPVDFLINRSVVELFGVKLWSVRLSSAVFGILAIPLIGFFARRISNAAIGLVAALLLAANPFHLYFSVEARPYAILAFASILFAYAAYNSLERRTWSAFAWLSLATIFGFGTSIFFLFAAGFSSLAMMCWLIITKSVSKKCSLFFCYCAAVTFAGAIAYILYVQIGLLDVLINTANSTNHIITQKSTYDAYQTTLDIITGFFSCRDYSPPKNVVVYVSWIVLALLLAGKPRTNTLLRMLAVLFTIAIPIVGYISYCKGGSYVLLPRYIIYAQPFIVLGLGYAICMMARLVAELGARVASRSISLSLRWSNLTYMVIYLLVAITLIGFITYKLWSVTVQPTFYGNWHKSVWYDVQEYVESNTNEMPVTTFIYVLYDFSGRFHLEYFRPSTNISVVNHSVFGESVPHDVFAPYIEEYILDKRKLIVVVNRNSWQPDKRIFDLVKTLDSYPAVDIYVARDLGIITNDALLSACVKQYGGLFTNIYNKVLQHKLAEMDDFNRLSLLISSNAPKGVSLSEGIVSDIIANTISNDAVLTAFVSKARMHKNTAPLLWHFVLAMQAASNEPLLRGHLIEIAARVSDKTWPLFCAATINLAHHKTYDWVMLKPNELTRCGFTQKRLLQNIHHLDAFYSTYGGLQGTIEFAKYVQKDTPEMAWWSVCRSAEAHLAHGETNAAISVIVDNAVLLSCNDNGIRRARKVMKKCGMQFPEAKSAGKFTNLLSNEAFGKSMRAWRYWQINDERTNRISFTDGYVRISNSTTNLIGIKQNVLMVSGTLYRLSANARSMVTNDPKILFGGRVALWLPPQPEQQLVWMSEYNNWWPKSLVFTNQVSGTAVVYVHMGYGKIASTGEFAAIRLEQIAE